MVNFNDPYDTDSVVVGYDCDNVDDDVDEEKEPESQCYRFPDSIKKF